MSSLGITASSVHRASSSRDNPGNKKQWIKPHSTMVGESQNGRDKKSHPLPRFSDNRWKNGSWDLNVFVRNGRMDWDSVIVAEARRRKCLEVFPEAAMNQEPVLFRSSIIPWWAWIMHSHLPQAELLNVSAGRAAMVGFFMSYMVDVLTGLDVVGQAGNFLGKAALLITVTGVLLFRKRQDFEKIREVADDATLYDKQWQASRNDQKRT